MTIKYGYLHYIMQRIIGESSTLAETLDHVSRVAALNRPILVVGERGSGKELIAERLHYLSKRWEESYHQLNCAAISEQLLDSDLFGHEAGAFTGASKTHLGRFERANGGTLFLDELATLPMRIQEKLLRIIEYGEFERLGGQKTLQVDVRIVAATNENLPKLAEQGKFRPDLLDRLAFDVINVPPLRKRLEDIPTLVEHFATRMCIELERDYYSGFSARTLQLLAAYSWPGNIRELKNVVERSVCHWHDIDEPIDSVVINPFAPEPEPVIEDVKMVAEAIKAEPSQAFDEKVRTFELGLIRQALAACQNQKKAADFMGVTYHQLRALLRKYKEDL